MNDVFKEALDTPQRARWEHQGVECAVHFVPHLWIYTGYCLIPTGHPLEKSPHWSDSDLSIALLEVHGGITFGPEPAEGGHIVGFDTAHYTDYTPLTGTGRRWTLDEVIAETNRMAEQIAEGQA